MTHLNPWKLYRNFFITASTQPVIPQRVTGRRSRSYLVVSQYVPSTFPPAWVRPRAGRRLSTLIFDRMKANPGGFLLHNEVEGM